MLQKLIITALLLLPLGLLAQTDFSLQKIKLPGATAYKDLFVTQSGNNYLLNGDIIVGQKNQPIAYQSNTENNYVWPKGYIPVQIEDSIFSMGFGNSVLKALDYFNLNTRVRFKPRTNESDYIFINYQSVNEMGFTGGNSWVGRHGGRQEFNLSTTSQRVILHELMHAIGFWHEQSRADRDEYVNILWGNLSDDQYKHNFQVEPGVAHGQYDYKSIMHYYSDAFAKSGTRTIECKFGQFISNCPMGSEALSAGDLTAVNAAYWYNNGMAANSFSSEYNKAELQTAKTFHINKSTYAIRGAGEAPADGIYKIRLNHTGKYLAIEGGDTRNGGKLVQWDFVDKPEFKFDIKKRADGAYEIKALHSGRYVGVAGGGKADGTPIIQWDYADKWSLYYTSDQGNPGWVIQHVNSSPMQLTGYITNTANGQPLALKQQQRLDAHDYEPVQTFSFERVGDSRPLTEKKNYGNVPSMIKRIKTGP